MKKKKKASTNEKADQFLAGLGTAGGAIGSPQLIGFGASDVQNQVISGNTDEYSNIRMRQGDTRIGESAAMPPDLDASYLKLNLYIISILAEKLIKTNAYFMNDI